MRRVLERRSSVLPAARTGARPKRWPPRACARYRVRADRESSGMDSIDDGPLWITLAWHQRGQRGRRGSIGVVDHTVSGWGAVRRHLDHPFGPVLMVHIAPSSARPLPRLEEDGWEIVDAWEIRGAIATQEISTEIARWWDAAGERRCTTQDIPAAPGTPGPAIHARPSAVQATWEHLARTVMATRGADQTERAAA